MLRALIYTIDSTQSASFFSLSSGWFPGFRAFARSWGLDGAAAAAAGHTRGLVVVVVFHHGVDRPSFQHQTFSFFFMSRKHFAFQPPMKRSFCET